MRKPNHFASSQGLIIKPRLGITDKALIEQEIGNTFLQLLIDLKEFQDSAPLGLSVMVYIRKLLRESVVNDRAEVIVRYGLEVIQSVSKKDNQINMESNG